MSLFVETDDITTLTESMTVYKVLTRIVDEEVHPKLRPWRSPFQKYQYKSGVVHGQDEETIIDFHDNGPEYSSLRYEAETGFHSFIDYNEALAYAESCVLRDIAREVATRDSGEYVDPLDGLGVKKDYGVIKCTVPAGACVTDIGIWKYRDRDWKPYMQALYRPHCCPIELSKIASTAVSAKSIVSTKIQTVSVDALLIREEYARIHYP
jgi:hypothetical protein